MKMARWTEIYLIPNYQALSADSLIRGSAWFFSEILASVLRKTLVPNARPNIASGATEVYNQQHNRMTDSSDNLIQIHHQNFLFRNIKFRYSRFSGIFCKFDSCSLAVCRAYTIHFLDFFSVRLLVQHSTNFESGLSTGELWGWYVMFRHETYLWP